jgi:hypothetical protein
MEELYVGAMIYSIDITCRVEGSNLLPPYSRERRWPRDKILAKCRHFRIEFAK